MSKNSQLLVLQRFYSHGPQIHHGIVEAHAFGLAHFDVEAAVEVEILVLRHKTEILDDAHHVVHGGVFEMEAVADVDGAFDDGGVLYGVASGGLVGVGEAAGTEQNAAKIAHHDDEGVGEVGAEQLTVDGAAAGAAGLAVVVGAEGVLVGSEDVGIAVVARVEVVLAQPVEVRLDFVDGAHGEGKGQELAAFFFVEPLGGRLDGMVCVVEHLRLSYLLPVTKTTCAGPLVLFCQS